MNPFKIIAIVIFCIAQNCEAQNWFSRQYHSAVSRYNYYYNAGLLIADAEENSLTSYKDDFKDVIVLYPVGDESFLKSNSANMDEVLKKCSHIIDKHSKGNWVDDSYLRMGNAQFYKGDFYAAIEVYEFVAGTYKNSICGTQAEINLIITYLQLKRYDDAEALYTKLNSKKDFPAKLKNQLNIAGAAVNIKQKKYPVAIKLLELTLPKIKNKVKKIRFNFALAQLYGLMKKNPDALLKYRKVVKLNPPYEFAFNAKLNMAKAINIKNRSEVREAMSTLRSMLKDDKNVDYFDQIYFELGNLELVDKNEPQAIVEYTNALRCKSNDLNIKSSSYLALADLYFKKQNYPAAQQYYDSAARSIDKGNPEYANVIIKNQILNELIKHLINIKEKDSLLKLSDNDKLREKTIDNIIKEEKKKAEEQQQLEERQKIQQQLQAQNPQGQVSTTNFPFYNQAAKTKGLQDFQRIWGNRELAEYWAISSNKEAIYKKFNDEQQNYDAGNEKKAGILKDIPNERKKYYENIPFSAAEKQKMRDEISESYFLGANVYYQNLKEPEKAKKMLEEMLVLYPKSKFEINAWYLLAKINKEQGKTDKYDYYVDLIKKADPNSSFLDVLEDSDSLSNTTIPEKVNDDVEQLYSKIYKAYKSKSYAEALELKKENDLKYTGNPLQVNFDYVEALVIGEQGNLPAFEKKLQAIVDNYPDTDIGKQANKTLQILKSRAAKTELPKAQSGKYKYDEKAPHFYMLVVPANTDMGKLKSLFSNFNTSQFGLDELQLTNSIVGTQYQIIIVNNFKDIAKAKEYILQIRGNNKLFVDFKENDKFQHFLISQENFSTLIAEKKLDDYIPFFNASYPN